MTKNIIIIVLLIIISYLARVEPEVIMVEVETKWCFYAEYSNLDNFKATKSPQMSFVNIKGSEYQVFVPCDRNLWAENDSM